METVQLEPNNVRYLISHHHLTFLQKALMKGEEGENLNYFTSPSPNTSLHTVLTKSCGAVIVGFCF